ncbi:cinnamoyl-CoA reductase 2-like [Panicum miliaceum]|uniref:Cinnamoyl-CoA reductase 2-like n=1 Tax=Panicum miliaceum TaxID=4540 RepID=A0A3L6SMJ3_PANMI|nr:cinnamoyl-CoA reductase 2-like [Panicum miliaceum]
MNGSDRSGMVWPAGERLDRKNAHLRSLDGAEERLSLCRADLLDYKSLCAAFTSCDGVFHVASPLSDNDPELMAVATEGTKNVINAAADTGVQRVVFTSSYGAVHMNPRRSPDQVVDESCWSDLEYCLQTKNFYCYAKTVAEKTAMEEASKRAIQLLVVVPSLTIGEILQPTLSLGIELLIVSYVKGTKKAYPNTVSGYVDVQDVARAHVLVYETPTAHGRYLCVGEVVHRSEFIRMMRELVPHYSNPFFYVHNFWSLGMKFTPLKESSHKTVVCLQAQGHIPMLSHKSAL